MESKIFNRGPYVLSSFIDTAGVLQKCKTFRNQSNQSCFFWSGMAQD